MPQIHFIEGPVGAGKSTYAMALAAQGGFAHIALDAWFVRLFSPDRPSADVVPWYLARKDRLIALILDHARALLASGQSVALELGLIQQAPRVALLRALQQEGIAFTVHVLDAPEDVRHERVRRRNAEQGATFAMVVPDHVFEIASSMWQAPDEIELEEFDFVLPGEQAAAQV
ncbi:Predicted kinase [Andreprevotia lacus DSM 23236]|jgi:predicted kinase|uniref:Predicted kinase n=1 Tax=Andreprevotia lacus DSM 23236 TaxID=1121001 RepID=A0A1W1Y0F2_9NEIS|nr:ATP-binding protein [Andreprevotia lacus]SMC29612.1 Predicted kinase [Andreprevotia lacus DSM 23236]